MRKKSSFYFSEKQKMLESVARYHGSQDFISEMKEAFFMFDKDKSGFICSKEMGHLLRTLGHNPTEAEVNNLIAEVDVDHNGKVWFIYLEQSLEVQLYSAFLDQNKQTNTI